MAIFKKKAEKAEAKTEPKKKAPAKKVEAKKEAASKAKSETTAPARTTGDAYRVLVRPLVTEKFSGQGTSYAFAVAPKANKLEIKKAIEGVYGVNVTGVRVMNVLGKVVRSRFGYGKRADWRKAIVTLKKGETIDLFTAKNA